MTSPLAIWETVTNLACIVGRTHEETEAGLQDFMLLMGITVVAISREMTSLALDAFRRDGKGNDFALTDIDPPTVSKLPRPNAT